MPLDQATVELRHLGAGFDYPTYDRGYWLSFGDDIRVPGTTAGAARAGAREVLHRELGQDRDPGRAGVRLSTLPNRAP